MLTVNAYLGFWIIYVMILNSWLILFSAGTLFVPFSRGNWRPVSIEIELIGKRNAYLIYSIILLPTILAASYATSYHQLSIYDPASFNEPLSVLDSLYFSLVTLTTVGYGDIAPRTELARVIVITQLIATMIFAVVVIGTIINIITTKPAKP